MAFDNFYQCLQQQQLHYYESAQLPRPKYLDVKNKTFGKHIAYDARYMASCCTQQQRWMFKRWPWTQDLNYKLCFTYSLISKQLQPLLQSDSILLKQQEKRWKTLFLELQHNMNCFPISPLYDADMVISCYFHYVNILFNDDQESLKKEIKQKWKNV